MKNLALLLVAVSNSVTNAKLGDSLHQNPGIRQLNQLQAFGSDPGFTLGRCQGDCDKDRDCQNSLVCFQRGANQAVPGCVGGRSDGSRTDYCVRQNDVDNSGNDTELRSDNEPSLKWSTKFPLELCVGDCDSDEDCATTLVCFQRGANQDVPGCSGGRDNGSRTDYCVYPNDILSTISISSPTSAPIASPPSSNTELKWSTRFPLGMCTGDCDRDRDCDVGLRCFQRNGYQSVPGCSGGSRNGSRTDYCVPESNIILSLPNPIPRPNPASTPSPPSSNTKLKWSTRFPLGRCTGDCDHDRDCDVGLRCFQRNEYQSVPGCLGGSRDGSKTDYCVPSSPVSSPVSLPRPISQQSGVISNVRLKLYWQNGYYWQEERREREWCMYCRNAPCDSGNRIYIHKCSSRSQKFDFIPQGGKYYLIKLRDRNLCFQRSSRRIYVRPCNGGNSRQNWYVNRGNSFKNRRFEISPKDDSNMCVTQQHHPKHGEDIYLERCSTARGDETSYWNQY